MVWLRFLSFLPLYHIKSSLETYQNLKSHTSITCVHVALSCKHLPWCFWFHCGPLPVSPCCPVLTCGPLAELLMESACGWPLPWLQVSSSSRRLLLIGGSVSSPEDIKSCTSVKIKGKLKIPKNYNYTRAHTHKLKINDWMITMILNIHIFIINVLVILRNINYYYYYF